MSVLGKPNGLRNFILYKFSLLFPSYDTDVNTTSTLAQVIVLYGFRR